VASLRDHYLLDLLALGVKPWETDRLAIRDLLRLCQQAEQMRGARADG
jgi:hypothetical protein